MTSPTPSPAAAGTTGERDPAAVQAATVRWDRLRACGSGPFYALPGALALVVAVQH
ncbi:MAG: hypothetical protein H0X38_18620, partial [Planctomycetes bacterium]|nr:hypothetical protein [Planctomycetota bacterium]